MVLVVLAAGAVAVATSTVPAGDAVEVENGSTYAVGTTLAFDVPEGDGEYDLYADGEWVMTRRASDGRIETDTDGFDPGSYELVDADTGEAVYEFSLERDGTPTPTPTLEPTDTPTPTPDAVEVEDGGTYDVDSTLAFDVPEDDGEYEFHTADDEWLATRRASGGRLVEAASYFGPGEYVLVDAETGEEVYAFSVTADGGTATTEPGDGTGTPTARGGQDGTATPSPAQVDGRDAGTSTGDGDASTATSGTTPTAGDGPDGETVDSPDRTGTTVPGFGWPEALAALLGALVALRRGGR